MNYFFEGWYFKHQTGSQTIAFIPAHHSDGKGNHSASIQIVSNQGSFHVPYSVQQFSFARCAPWVIVGNNLFTRSGIKINIKSRDVTAYGTLQYRNLTPLRYDIMGPFRFVPFMECRHRVISMSHSVSGTITLNGTTMQFHDDAGYWEGDRGRSFPKRYVWTQCSFQNGSVMLSVADIPLSSTHFTGIIGAILIGRRQYRLATYLGARAPEIEPNRITVVQGNYQLIIERQTHCDTPLKAPVQGGMSRTVHESPSCRARYRFLVGGTSVLDITSAQASFEYEYPSMEASPRISGYNYQP